MSTLHRAALVRAYRTLATGLGGSTVVTAAIAVVAALGGSAETLRTAALAAAAAIGTTVVSAVGSFWRGVAQGLPEVPALTPSEVEADTQAAANDVSAEPYIGRHEA